MGPWPDVCMLFVCVVIFLVWNFKLLNSHVCRFLIMFFLNQDDQNMRAAFLLFVSDYKIHTGFEKNPCHRIYEVVAVPLTLRALGISVFVCLP